MRALESGRVFPRLWVDSMEASWARARIQVYRYSLRRENARHGSLDAYFPTVNLNAVTSLSMRSRPNTAVTGHRFTRPFRWANLLDPRFKEYLTLRLLVCKRV